MNLIEIGIVLYPRAHLASVWGLTDLLKYANSVLNEKSCYKLKISHWTERDEKIINVHNTCSDINSKVNFIVIPPSFESPIVPEEAKNYTIWLRELYETGTILCSVCSGIFMLIETGLLDGRIVTTHWLNGEIIKEKYPSVCINDNKIIIEDTDIITTAGVMSWMDLGLKLIERIYGTSIMINFAKLLLIDPPLREQSYYRNFSPNFSHYDKEIINIQHWLQKNFSKKFTIDLLAELVSLEKRTLLRRFKKSTGHTIIEYCQHLRIQKAQDLLLTTNLSFEKISWQVGYQDSSSFNKVFMKHIGLSSTEYRKRFKNI
ncbi:TPA: GlxA family transcriptional regulator [Acinetobacter baumannii]|nr:GlxA family transcriptional regulator [Acinetobacter baumannii]